MKQQHLAQALVLYLQEQSWQLRCVESCTAGALTASIGQISGISTLLDRSWITYSNQAKIDEVNVCPALLQQHGAVSQVVAIAMAEGAVTTCASHTLAIAITGIAGPTGGSPDKPVGSVWIAIKAPHQAAYAHYFHFAGSRIQVQKQAVQQALQLACTQTKHHLKTSPSMPQSL